MRYLKKYESLDEFNLDFALSKISEEFPKSRVDKMFNDEWPNWVDDSWEEDGYTSDHDWYDDHNNGEAEDVVYDELISWFCKKYNKKLSDQNKENIKVALDPIFTL